MRLEAHGFIVEVPRGWDARIFRRAESDVPVPSAPDDADIPQSGLTNPVVHLASFALPQVRGDYGSGAVDRMRADDVFIALLEFGEESVGSALFAGRGMPRFRAGEFSTATLQRPDKVRAGAQRFCVIGGRAICCYVVVGSVTRRSALTPIINRSLANVTVATR